MGFYGNYSGLGKGRKKFSNKKIQYFFSLWLEWLTTFFFHKIFLWCFFLYESCSIVKEFFIKPFLRREDKSVFIFLKIKNKDWADNLRKINMKCSLYIFLYHKEWKLNCVKELLNFLITNYQFRKKILFWIFHPAEC